MALGGPPGAEAAPLSTGQTRSATRRQQSLLALEPLPGLVTPSRDPSLASFRPSHTLPSSRLSLSPNITLPQPGSPPCQPLQTTPEPRPPVGFLPKPRLQHLSRTASDLNLTGLARPD